MKKIIAFALSFVLMLTFSVSMLTVSAADYNCKIDTHSRNVYVENLDTGIVVYEENATEKVPPASLTKIMTYIVVVDSIPDLVNTKVTVTAEALSDLDPASSVMGLANYIGQEFSVLDLLYGLMLPSGNDAALVLANYIGDGVVGNFVDMMNRKAGQLGCSSTHFVNPHGLYDSNHYSTAFDLATMTKYAYQKPYFDEITSTPSYKVIGMSEILENTNYMINPYYTMYYYDYAHGGKTGYTDEAGKCLVSTAKKDDYNYLCVTLGAPYSFAEDVNYAMIDSYHLYDWAFNNISYVELLSETEVVDTLAVEFVWGNEFVDAVPQGGMSALLPNDYDKSLVTTNVDLPEYVSAPIEMDEVLGTISVYYNNELVGTTNLISKEEIKRDQSNYLMHRFIGFVVNNVIWLTIVFIIVVVFVVVKINANRNKKKRQARYRYR